MSPVPFGAGNGVPGGFECGKFTRKVVRRDETAEKGNDRRAYYKKYAVGIADMGNSEPRKCVRAGCAFALLAVLRSQNRLAP